MAEIAAADDVRGHEVYARQVIEEAAKRGSEYAETLLKTEEAPADEQQDFEPTEEDMRDRFPRPDRTMPATSWRKLPKYAAC